MPTSLDSIQLVAFTLPVNGRDTLAMWRKLFKTPPSNFNQVPGGVGQCSGQVGAYNVTLQSQPSRVDLILTGPPIPSTPPILEDGEEALKFGQDRMAALIPTGTQRVAMVIQRSDEQPDLAAAIAAIKRMVPHLSAPGDAVDLSYQVAVPRPSKVMPGLDLHLLTRWNTGSKSLIKLNVGAAGVSVDQEQETRVISALYLDLYSSQPRSLFPKKAIAVLDELAEYARQLLSRGYASLV